MEDNKLTPEEEDVLNQLLTAYNKFVDFNPSFKMYVILMGFQTGYRPSYDLAAFAGRLLDKRSSFKIESLALSITFMHYHSIN